MEQYIWNGERIGAISYHKRKRITMFRKEEHIYRLYNSIGIAEIVLKDLINNGVDEIYLVLTRKDGQEVYKTTPTDWIKHGKDVGEKVHLTLNKWLR